MKTYETLSEAVNDLVERGYGYKFNMKRDFCPLKAETHESQILWNSRLYPGL